jgi:ADP-heptose:LPS heptosyltransferase
LGIAVLRPAAMALGAILRRDHSLAAGREIVWVKMLGGGSLILAMPMLLGIRRAYPNTRMVLITTPSVKPFAELLGVFDEYRVIDNRGVLALVGSGLRSLAKTFRADCIVDLEVHSRLTTVFTTLTMARNRVSFWLEDIFWRRGLASHLVFFNRSSGSFHFYDRIADLFSVPIASQEDCRRALHAAIGLTEAPARVGGQVAIGFACSDLGQERMLTPEQWVRVFEANVRRAHRTFVFLGGPADRAQAQRIIDVLQPIYPDRAFENHCGASTLAQSTRTLFASEEFWGIDSSLLHLARIAGVRCVSYWGPTDPSTRLRQTWAVDEVTHYRKIACSPCVHTSEDPPCGGDNRCIKGLFEPGVNASDWTPIAYPKRRTRALATP